MKKFRLSALKAQRFLPRQSRISFISGKRMKRAGFLESLRCCKKRRVRKKIPITCRPATGYRRSGGERASLQPGACLPGSFFVPGDSDESFLLNAMRTKSFHWFGILCSFNLANILLIRAAGGPHTLPEAGRPASADSRPPAPASAVPPPGPGRPRPGLRRGLPRKGREARRPGDR